MEEAGYIRDSPIPRDLVISWIAEHYHVLPGEVLKAGADETMYYYRLSSIYREFYNKRPKSMR